ncbi:MAG TPA: phage tail protein [Rugosimonospora sp.]|jgi:phage tail-like protein
MPLNDATKLGLANRFSVTIDFAAYDLGSWAQVDGLTVKWSVAEYRAGDAGNARWYFPGNTEYTTVKLTRAASEDSKAVKKWLSDTSFKWQPYTGHVVLHDSGGAEIMEWTLQHVMPVHWQIVGFDAMASKVATESLELAHLGFLEDAKSL